MTAAAALVLLNHFYVTPDRATFEAVERSEAAQALGAWEKRTTVRKDTSYTGLYLYGENTYLELLHPDSKLGAPYGIAWHGRLSTPALIHRGEVPWFLISRLPQLEGLSDWGMEYVPEFFRGFHPELPPQQPRTDRADALTRYAASCGKLRERAEGLFENVTALEVSLSAPDLKLWRARALEVEGAEIRVSPGARTAIAAAHLRLRRDAGKSTHPIGSTTLTLDGRTAVWRYQGEVV